VSTRVLMTGYEGESIRDFIPKLVLANVEMLIDVRRFASSRKPGFSKNALREVLEDVDIEYLHLPNLGMPKDLLKRRHELSDNGPILDAYDELLPQRQSEINILLEAAETWHSCLLCYEADETQCHRTRLARFISAQRPDVIFISLSNEIET